MNKRITLYILILLFITDGSSCRKFVLVPPPNDQLNSNTIFEDSASAESAITGIYGNMMSTSGLFANSATTLYAGMSADELYFYTASNMDEFVNNDITIANHITLENLFWKPAYKYIYAANLAIEKLSASTGLSNSFKNQLKGEALFIRAFCYFHLVNLFGAVPLVTSSDYRTTSVLKRSGTEIVYQQIMADLNEAESLLTADYPTDEKVRPNRWTVTAFLARVYLYTSQWDKAEAAADSVIGSGLYFLEPDPNNVFLSASNETIWQLQPVVPGINTSEGEAILPFTTASAPTYLFDTTVINAFEPGDARKDAWTQTRVFSGQTVSYPYKYKRYNGFDVTEYYVVFRLAEQYLIRAEANMQQQKFEEAAADLNIIRNRAGLGATSAGDMISLKAAIEQERRIELLAEWGHRWYDLKRTGRADAVLGAAKGAHWQTTDALWPIPQNQLNLDPDMSQNPGY